MLTSNLGIDVVVSIIMSNNYNNKDSNSGTVEITESELQNQIADDEEFLEVESQIQDYQHDTVENAVNAYVTDMRIDTGDVIAEVEVPAYDETIDEKVADITGLNEESNLASYVDDLQRIGDLVSHNPIPVQKEDEEIRILDEDGESSDTGSGYNIQDVKEYEHKVGIYTSFEVTEMMHSIDLDNLNHRDKREFLKEGKRTAKAELMILAIPWVCGAFIQLYPILQDTLIEPLLLIPSALFLVTTPLMALGPLLALAPIITYLDCQYELRKMN